MNKRGDGTFWNAPVPPSNTAPIQSAPASSGSGGNVKPGHTKWVALFLLILGIADVYAGYSGDIIWIFGVNLILGVYGLLHLFSYGMLTEIFQGVLPLVLVVFALPSMLGGAGIISSIPVAGSLAPAGILRYVILLVIIAVYYWRPPTGAAYGGMVGRASKSAYSQAKKVVWKVSTWRVIGLILLIAAIYGLETGGGLSSLIGLGDAGVYLVPIILFLFGGFMVFRGKTIDSIAGFVSLLLGFVGIVQLLDYGSMVDWIFGPLLPGQFLRYIVILIIIIFFTMRGTESLSSST